MSTYCVKNIKVLGKLLCCGTCLDVICICTTKFLLYEEDIILWIRNMIK